MPEIPKFIPADHAETFRKWLDAICSKERVSERTLLGKVDKWMKAEAQRTGIPIAHVLPSDSTLRRIRKGVDTAGMESGQKLRPFWEYFWSVATYKNYYPGEVGEGSSVSGSDASTVLATALEVFLMPAKRKTHRNTRERVNKLLEGRFVMYRPDYELASRHVPQPNLIRASRIDIRAAAGYAVFSELQDFPEQREYRRPKHYQVNSGVLLPYGDYVVGLMNAERAVSFKCVVIDKILSDPEPGDEPTRDFSGKMLVASDRGLFPSARFFCRRSLEENPGQYGIKEYAQVDEDIVHYLSTSTFRNDFHPIL